ncbi:MAG: amidohydrolase family protein [Saprospiraceae bacterium]|nr:amidohydrolase family protein [Saprospiraceae bacterium]
MTLGNLSSLLLIANIGLLLSCQQGRLVENGYCLENVTVLDPLDAPMLNQTVIIEGNRISEIAPSAELRLSNKNTIIDGTGKFVMPGLWDAHVHFAFLEELAPRMLDLFLCYGITSVRDIGGRLDFVKKWKDEAMANPDDAPRVMMAGPLLDGMPNVYDGSTPFTPALSVGLATVQDVREAVSTLIDAGVDLLKAYEMLTPEQFAEVIRLGKEHGLPVTGHVPLSMDVIQASSLGLNSMEHLRNLELSCASLSDDLLAQRLQMLADGKGDPGSILRSRLHDAQRKAAVEHFSSERTKEVLDVLATNETWQVPTSALSTASVKRPFAREDFQQSFRFLPSAMEGEWKEQIEGVILEDPTDFQIEYAKWLVDMVGRIHEHGIEIMAGTDCPIFFLTPGRSLHEELSVLTSAGLSEQEVLKAATLNPARYFGLDDELGRVRVGMIADLVVLNSNPLVDIANTQDIEAVIKNGKLHSRMMLDEKLSNLDKQ